LRWHIASRRINRPVLRWLLPIRLIGIGRLILRLIRRRWRKTMPTLLIARRCRIVRISPQCRARRLNPWLIGLGWNERCLW